MPQKPQKVSSHPRHHQPRMGSHRGEMLKNAPSNTQRLPEKTRHLIMNPSPHTPSDPFPSPIHRLRGCGLRTLGASGLAVSESVGEAAGDGLHVAHAAGTGGLPSLGLLAPVDCFVLFPYSLCPSRGLNIHWRILAAGYPHEEQVCFWMWRDRRPVCVFCQPVALNASSTLHGTASTEAHRGRREGVDVPQRLHSVCVLLWRFPKLEVPFAISQSVSRPPWG